MILLLQGTTITKLVTLPQFSLPDSISVSFVRQGPDVGTVSQSGRGPSSVSTTRGGRGGRGGRGFLHPASPAPPVKRKGGAKSGPCRSRPVKRANTSRPLGRLCRLCDQADFAVFSLEEKPEIVLKVRELLDIRLDLEADRQAGYPEVVCIQCCNSLLSFATFKGNVSRAQILLEQRLSREVEVVSEDSPER